MAASSVTYARLTVPLPCRAAVDDLLSQDVEAVEDEAEHPSGIAGLEGVVEGAGRVAEGFLPVGISLDPVIVLPER